jgi:hypothetical protein
MATGRRRAYALVAGVLAAACLTVGPGATATPSAPAATIVAPTVVALRQWTSASSNLMPVQGTVELNGKPVAGVRVKVDDYIPAATRSNGTFTYLVDDTLLQRHLVTVADTADADFGTARLTDAQRSALEAATAAITVAYPVSDVHVSRNGAGEPVVTGRIVDSAGQAPPHVSLATYALSGTVTDASGKPVAGAQVSTRTVDRDFWTVSTITDAGGHYTSLFTASDEDGNDPVPVTVRVANGKEIYQFLPAEYVYFRRLQSATLDLQLPPQGFAMALPLPKSYPGAVYTGTVVGATAAGGAVIKPVKTSWLDAKGNFTMTLPRSYAGKSVSLWEGKLALFSADQAVAGGRVDLKDWPTTLAPSVARDLQRVHL